MRPGGKPLHRGEGAAAQPAKGGRRCREDEIERAAADLVDQDRRRFDGEFKFQPGLALAQPFHHRNQPGMQHGLDRAKPQRHGLRSTRTHFRFHFPLQFQEALRMSEEAQAGHSEPELLVATVQKEHAQFVFERGNAAGNG